MSTAHLSLDDFAFPGHRPHSAYELSYALGAPQNSSLLSHGGLDASPNSAHAPADFHQLPSDSAHAAYLPEHLESYLTQQYAAMGYPTFGAHLPPYSMQHRPPSPRTVHAANSGWGPTETYGASYEASASSSTFLNNLQNVIDSSHTSQIQQSANATHAGAQQLSGPSSSSWTLSGSLDPATGVFQRSFEHPRLRTAQACEKCRIRKAKCSGDHPTCQRCLSRGLQCEYAPERKMRGPNKNKRKSISQKRTDPSPSDASDDRRGSIASIASTVSSGSDASVLDAPASAAATAGAAVSSGTRPPSRGSPLPNIQYSPMRSDAPRQRSTSIALGQIQRAAEYGSMSPAHGHFHTSSPSGRQRPPPLDLSDARQFQPNYTSMMAQYARTGQLNPSYGSSDGMVDGRRTSLPPYLLEAYSRVALANNENAQESAFYDSSAFLAPSSATAASSSAESSGMARYVHLPSLRH
ncbi:hypothetical protein BV20DRAFT_816333 [Pilatotrama ljubarskyi]|nr:hypothetical protein BV20DRAFT_816333 [Pilatotrama ljubarskyi]